ncbi:MAG TPA: hypothetical protein VEA37_12165 [Flavobacterium sp.]|nr:hypothetical protein [Flavobacterium sp.]
MKYSKSKVYKNGNRVAVLEDSDHVKVRTLLYVHKVVEKVDNFGPLLSDAKIPNGCTIVIHGDYELHVKHMENVMGFCFEYGLNSIKGVNWVWYQRINP